MPTKRETSQDKPQVRLDPDVAAWIRECAEDYELSLGATTNKMLRVLMKEAQEPVIASPPPVPRVEVVDDVEYSEPVTAPKPTENHAPQRRAKGVNPRAAAILARNRADAR